MTTDPLRLVVVTAGVSEPSSTRLLADRAAQKTLDLLRESGMPATVGVIELGPLAVDIAQAIVSGFPERAPAERDRAARRRRRGHRQHARLQGRHQRAVQVVRRHPRQRPAHRQARDPRRDRRHGPARHGRRRAAPAALRVPARAPGADLALRRARGLGRLRAGRRIERAATELVLLLQSGVGRSIADSAWTEYQHQFAGNATRAERGAPDVDFDTDLMRLAAGGSREAAVRV